MKTAIKVISGFLAVLLLSGYFAYTVVAMDVKPVENFTVEQKGLNFQKLSWQMSQNVSGYKIYQKNAKSDDYTLIKTVENSSVTECKIENLDVESFYTFKISAYKSLLGYVSEGLLSEPLNTCTLPKGEDIESIVEQSPKTLTVSWTRGINCDGYEIDYSADKSFSDYETRKVNSINTKVCKLDGLKVGETYYVRLRSFINFEDETVYSEYSDIYSATVKNTVTPENLDPSKPVIALTFDDGPDFNGSSKKILDVLEQYGVPATFFTVGQNAEKNPENIKRKVALGCEIGNHTYSHTQYGSKVKASEILKCSNVIEKITGSRPTVFRSTGGLTTSLIKSTCKKQGMSLYYWTIDTEDWKSSDAKKIYKAAMQAKDGDIILMHDIYPSTAKAVKKIVPKLLKKGYQFLTVSELVKYKSGSDSPKPGIQYLSGTKISK